MCTPQSIKSKDSFEHLINILKQKFWKESPIITVIGKILEYLRWLKQLVTHNEEVKIEIYQYIQNMKFKAWRRRE